MCGRIFVYAHIHQNTCKDKYKGTAEYLPIKRIVPKGFAGNSIAVTASEGTPHHLRLVEPCSFAPALTMVSLPSPAIDPLPPKINTSPVMLFFKTKNLSFI